MQANTNKLNTYNNKLKVYINKQRKKTKKTLSTKTPVKTRFLSRFGQISDKITHFSTSFPAILPSQWRCSVNYSFSAVVRKLKLDMTDSKIGLKN